MKINTPQPLSENDIVEGMRSISGYIDLTPHDFRELYEVAYGIARKRILHETTAAHIMTTPAITVQANQTLASLLALLAEKNISGAPVLNEEGAVIGVISQKDILARLGATPEAGSMQLLAAWLLQGKTVPENFLHTPVAALMTTPAQTVTPTTTLEDMVLSMKQRHINRLPVVDAAQKILGIISRTDIMNAYTTLLA